MKKLTHKHYEILVHSLGVDLKKKFPKEFYRNHYCSGEYDKDYQLLIDLKSMGLMNFGNRINNGRDVIFWVTLKGVEELRSFCNSQKPKHDLRCHYCGRFMKFDLNTVEQETIYGDFSIDDVISYHKKCKNEN